MYVLRKIVSTVNYKSSLISQTRVSSWNISLKRNLSEYDSEYVSPWQDISVHVNTEKETLHTLTHRHADTQTNKDIHPQTHWHMHTGLDVDWHRLKYKQGHRIWETKLTSLDTDVSAQTQCHTRRINTPWVNFVRVEELGLPVPLVASVSIPTYQWHMCQCSCCV